MKKMQAQWIWPIKDAQNDEYADFRAGFTAGKSTVLRISADSNYAAYVNGEIAAWGKYPDYPHYRIMDERVVALQTGVNHVALRVWHIGKDSFTYRKGEACVAAEMAQGGKILFATGEATQGRISPLYVNHRQQDVTLQLGLKYRYDARLKTFARPQTPAVFLRCIVAIF